LERLEKDLKEADKNFELEKTVLEMQGASGGGKSRCASWIDSGKSAKPIGGFLFLSQRPMLFVLNS